MQAGGVTPQAHCNTVAAQFEALWRQVRPVIHHIN